MASCASRAIGAKEDQVIGSQEPGTWLPREDAATFVERCANRKRAKPIGDDQVADKLGIASPGVGVIPKSDFQAFQLAAFNECTSLIVTIEKFGRGVVAACRPRRVEFLPWR